MNLELSRLADGGVVTKPTLAVIGEEGPEAVVPLEGAPGQPPMGQPPMPGMPGTEMMGAEQPGNPPAGGLPEALQSEEGLMSLIDMLIEKRLGGQPGM